MLVRWRSSFKLKDQASRAVHDRISNQYLLWEHNNPNSDSPVAVDRHAVALCCVRKKTWRLLSGRAQLSNAGAVSGENGLFLMGRCDVTDIRRSDVISMYCLLTDQKWTKFTFFRPKKHHAPSPRRHQLGIVTSIWIKTYIFL